VNDAETSDDLPTSDAAPASDAAEPDNVTDQADAQETVADSSGDESSTGAAAADSVPKPPPPKAPPKAKVEEPRDTIRSINLDGSPDTGEAPKMDWYILKVAFNREDTIADALRKKVKMEGMEEFFGEIVVPTEDVATFTRDGKRRISKRKLLPGYIMVNMLINDDTWFMCRETGGISDFTGAAGKPMPMEPSDIERFINRPEVDDEEEAPIKIGIPFKVGDRVRVKEGNFENQEGDVDAVDEANGRITVIINIFGRSVPMELDHWQVEPL
jgi:transcriptional antiterminator NusG